jgi:enediyne biosynthesis thioesterase
MDEIKNCMRVAFVRQNRIGLDFDYYVVRKESEILAARGFQEIGCMHAQEEGLVAVAPPLELMAALVPYMDPRS